MFPCLMVFRSWWLALLIETHVGFRFNVITLCFFYLGYRIDIISRIEIMTRKLRNIMQVYDL